MDKMIVFPFEISCVANAYNKNDIVPELYLKLVICLNEVDISAIFKASSFVIIVLSLIYIYLFLDYQSGHL